MRAQLSALHPLIPSKKEVTAAYLGCRKGAATIRMGSWNPCKCMTDVAERSPTHPYMIFKRHIISVCTRGWSHARKGTDVDEHFNNYSLPPGASSRFFRYNLSKLERGVLGRVLEF